MQPFVSKARNWSILLLHMWYNFLCIRSNVGTSPFSPPLSFDYLIKNEISSAFYLRQPKRLLNHVRSLINWDAFYCLFPLVSDDRGGHSLVSKQATCFSFNLLYSASCNTLKPVGWLWRVLARVIELWRDPTIPFFSWLLPGPFLFMIYH